MKKKINYYKCLLIIFLLTVISCSERVNDNLISIQGYDEDELENGEGIEIESFEIINLELTDKSIINFISHVEIIDTLLIVKSDDKLLAFNCSGKFLYQFGEKGNGPNEYIDIRSFVIDRNNKNLKIIDQASHKIITFDINGNYLSTKRYDEKFLPDFTHWGICIDDDNILFANMIFNNQNTIYSIANINKEQTNALYNFSGKTQNAAVPTGKSPMSYFKNEFKLTLPFDNKIYTLQDGKMFPKMIIQTEKSIVKENQQKGLNDYEGIMTHIEFIDKGYFAGITSIFETNNYTLLEMAFGYNYFLFSKTSNKGRLYNYSIKKDLKTLPLINIIGCSDDHLIGVGTPMLLRGKSIEDTTNENILKLKKHLDSLSYDANPTLFIYKLN